MIVINRQPWEQVAGQYRFVDDMAALSPNVHGAGNRERFDWWLNSFRFARSMAQVGCVRGALDNVMEQVVRQTSPQEQLRLVRDQALPLREQLVQLVGEMCGYLLATLHNSSELGTLVNIEQQSLLRTQLLVAHDGRLEQILGEPLPASTKPWKDYRGPARLVVPSVRTAQARGEALHPRLIVLDKHPPQSLVIHVRPLGGDNWQAVSVTHTARAVYQATLPAAQDDFEYFAEATLADGRKLVWPATAPQLCQTVVIQP